MFNTVYISLGSNMGNREGNLKSALIYIEQLDDTRVIDVSKYYETEPVGYLNQGSFLNLAAKIETSLYPVDLLKMFQEIESKLKRVRDIRWGPRTIDIDILLYGDLKMDLPELIIPHPRMLERGFVLIPLKDIYKGEYILGKSINELIEKCDDKNGVKFFDKNSLIKRGE
ncbi:MAG: 2-amino-4-hydroxy-6-hydroxymethyldihydropteridine diphosphokinase [Bacillota bacterium]|nr:2-amino-4-hydroxy-6-hydroxymethyldihydropteridine diphosphokinase [Bacillota bacterium]